LKPANIMLTRSGIKLLDFGLAKAFAKPTDESLASTAGAPAGLTQDGLLLGTVPYMAPEQVEGKPVDAKTDIFAFGAVLFEMATGIRAFGGTSQAAVMTAILTHDPPSLSALAPSAPPPLGRLVRRCLARDPAARWSSTADLELQLREIAETAAAGAAPERAGAASAGARAAWLPWAIAGLAIVASLVALWRGQRPAAVATAAMPVRFQVRPSAGTSFSYHSENPYLAVSPDGAQVAYLATDTQGRSFVWLRSLAALEARPLAGTAGASSVFWSPDGKSIGFVADDKLQRISLAGSAPAPICDLSGATGVSANWGSSGDILFAPILGGAIYRVPASGGTPVVAVGADSSRGEWRAGWPWFLPDGQRFLFLLRRMDGRTSIMYSAPGSSPRELLDACSAIAFTEPDLLVYVQEGTLFGRHFDWRAGRLVGGPFPVADTVRYFQSTAAAGYATSAGGTLVYQSSADVMQLTWLDRTGRELGTLGSPGEYLDLCLSPDGGKLLLSRRLPRIGTYDVWSYDIARGTEVRLTPGTNSDFGGRWLPGGRSIAFSTVEGGLPRLHRLDLETGKAEVLLGPTGFQVASDVSPDGRTLAYLERTPASDFAAWSLPLAGGEGPARLLPPGLWVSDLRFSPDGRHFAFLSNESGRFEAYIAPFPGPGERVRLSTGGAQALRWPRAANEILYLSPDNKVISVPVRTAPSLQLGTPRVLFTLAGAAVWPDFEVTPDGQRILAIVPRVDANQLPLTVLVNWPQAAGK
jgi:Tol biopolymer transport system component